MSGKAESGVLLGLVAIGAGLWLLKNPRCQHGCRFMAEHLVKYGFNALKA